MAAALINGIAIGLPFRNGKSEGVTPSPYPKGIVGAWKGYGKTNVDSDRGILKDYSGNKRDLTLMNVSYALGSGYGIWSPSFNTSGSLIKVPHTDYSFTVPVKISMEEADFGFWAFGNGVKPLKFNLKVSNLADTDEVYMCQYTSKQYGKVRLYNGLNSISINIEDSTRPDYPYISLYSRTPITQEFTSIVVPDYEGGLVLDGIDDYAVNNNMPILTKEKGYTLFVVGKILGHSSATNDLKCLVSNTESWFSNGAFIYNYENLTPRTVSFGNTTDLKHSSLFGYQTSVSYNGAPIIAGSFLGTTTLYLSRISKTNARYTNMVFYAAELYDHDLTAEEIQQVSNRMLAEWYEKAYSPLATPYQALWTENGKTNQDTDKSIPNLVDATNPLLPSNFAWGGNSGYNKYTLNYTGWISTDNRIDFTLNDHSINITKVNVVIDFQSIQPTSAIASVPAYQLRVTGLKEGGQVRVIPSPYLEENVYTISADGTYNIPVISGVDYQFAGYGIKGYVETEECNITIEQIPSVYGLSLDGVDDNITSRLSLPALAKYTVVGDFDIITNVAKGINKISNWYVYKNAIFINSTSLIFSVQNAFAISSSGLVLNKDTAYVTDKVGTNIFGNAVRTSPGVDMIFCSLAIVPYELNEAQIRATLEYLKTIKANNIG